MEKYETVSKLSRTSIIVGAIVLIALIASFSSVTVVETGFRGVKTIFGKVEGDPLPEGIYFTSPFTTTIHQMDIRIQKVTDKVEIYTKDAQTASVQYAVNFSLKGSEAGEMYKTVGIGYSEKLIPQVVQGSLKNAAGKWEAIDIISHREDVRSEVERALASALAARGIVVEGFQMVDVQFTKEFDKAVEAKVIAIQNAEQARNKTVQISEQAKQTVISAQADAQAMKIKSDALSQNQNLVQYEAVQKWNGVLPQYMMGNAVPFIGMPSR